MTPDTAVPDAGRTPPAWRVLVPAGIVEVAVLGAAGWWPGGAPAVILMPLLAVAFIVYAIAASRVLRAQGGHTTIWLFAIAMRLVLLPCAPELSHDIYRYLWDGHVQVAGINPFRYAPLDPSLIALRTSWFALLPDPQSLTPFPPAAQIVFATLALAGGAVLQAKLLWVALDLTAGWVLGRIAAITGRSRRLTQILYLWSPLLVVEVAWNGHLAPLLVLGICLVILLARVPGAAGVAAAVATFAAWAPIGALAPLTARLGRRFLGAFLALAAVVAVPYLGAGAAMFTGLIRHFGTHRFFAGPFLLIDSAAPNSTVAHAITGVAVLGVIAWATARRFRPERALFWTLGAILLVTPELRPWFVLWVLPMAALRVDRTWLLLSGLVLLTYAGVDVYRETGTWPEPLWARLALWLPFLALLARDAMLAWRRRFPVHARPAA